MQTTDNLGLKLYEGTDLFNPLVVENPNCETLDEAIKAISDQAVGSATELVTGTVHALTRGLDDADRDVFIFTATSNFTAGDTFTLDGQQVSALTVAGTPLATGCYIVGSSVLVHKRDTLLTFYVSETTAKDAEKLGGELPSYYATDSDLDAAVADIGALATKVGTAVLTTQAPDLSGAVNELNTHLTNLSTMELISSTSSASPTSVTVDLANYSEVGVALAIGVAGDEIVYDLTFIAPSLLANVRELRSQTIVNNSMEYAAVAYVDTTHVAINIYNPTSLTNVKAVLFGKLK